MSAANLVLGSTGPTGPIGKQGLQGPQGLRGITGPDGSTGPLGKQGFQGDKGVQGPEGPTGPIGKQGLQGLRGIQGPEGPAGLMGKTGGVGPLGFRGEQGPEGPAGLMGKTGGVGPQGFRGEQGPDGPVGLMGKAGPDGDKGPDGIQGEKGKAGPEGDKGNKGPDGPAGPMGNPGPDGSSNFLFAPGTFVESMIHERITLGIEPRQNDETFSLLNRDTDFQYDANWEQHPSYASLQEISEFSIVFQSTQDVCDLSSISWIGEFRSTQDQVDQQGFGDGGEPPSITVSLSKMNNEELFLTTDTQSDNRDTTYGQITYKNVRPTAHMNGRLGHSAYVLRFDDIPNICPFEPDIWYKIIVKYDRPMRTLVYDFTSPIAGIQLGKRVDIGNSYIIQSENNKSVAIAARTFAVAAQVAAVEKNMYQVVPLNIDCSRLDPTRPQMRASMTICKPNYYQFENLPSWEYCQRFDIKGVLCLYEGGFLRISGSRPSAFDEIVSKMKAPQGGGRFDEGITGPNTPINENPTPSDKPIWYPVYAETQQGYMNGSSVSINHDGTIIAIGSPNENCVRVYMQTNRGWIQRGNTINQNDPSGDLFGTTITMNGNGSQIYIGSLGQVAVFVYDITTDCWLQYGTLPNENDGIQSTSFGSSISVDTTGNRIIVGCPTENKHTDGEVESETYNSGRAYIYDYGGEPGYWILMYVIGDEFKCGRTGASVSINDDGTLFAVGSPNSYDKNPGLDDGGTVGCGSVRIFAYNNEYWSQIGVVRGQNQFGQSVSIIGSPANHILGATAQDRLCAYNNVEGTSDYSTIIDKWLPTSLKNTTVHISRAGDHIAFGYDDCVQKVLVYETATQTSFTITDIATDELLSHMDVRISQQGNRIVIGAPLSSDFLNKGMVYVYENKNKPIGNLPELNGTEPFGRIYELQNQALSASDTIITVGSVATIQIRSGMVETVEIFVNDSWVPLYMNNEVKGDMYYILSEYTDTGCMMSICNIPVPDIFVRLNNELQITKVFRHYNLDGPQYTDGPVPAPKPVPVSDNAIVFGFHNNKYGPSAEIVIRSGIVETVDVLVADEWTRIYTNAETSGMYYIVSEYTDTGCVLTINNISVYDISVRVNDLYVVSEFKNYEPVPVPVVPVPVVPISDIAIVFESYINNKYGPSVYIPIRSGIVESVAILVANEWIHIYTDAETSGMYYNMSDYTDTGCLLTIHNIPVDDIQVLVNNRFMVSKFNIYGPTPAPDPKPTEYQLRVLELQAQKNVSAGDIIYDGSSVSVQIRSGMVATLDISINRDWIRLSTKSETKGGMYYRLGDYTDTGCILYIYNVYVSELVLRVNEILQMTTINMPPRIDV